MRKSASTDFTLEVLRKKAKGVGGMTRNNDIDSVGGGACSRALRSSGHKCQPEPGKENWSAGVDLDLSAFEIGLCFKDMHPEIKSAKHYVFDIQHARDMNELLRIWKKESSSSVVRADRVAEMYL